MQVLYLAPESLNRGEAHGDEKMAVVLVYPFFPSLAHPI